MTHGPTDDRAVPAPARVVLLGLMGAGKTTVARAVAQALGWPRLDNDEQVTAATGATAREVARHDGLDRLHEVEADVLRDVLDRPPPVVATAAASVIDDPALAGWLADRATTVWLRARPETLAGRVLRDPDRPILAGAGRDAVTSELEAQLARRGPRLEQLADLVVDVDDRSPAQIADLVVAALAGRSPAAPVVAPAGSDPVPGSPGARPG